MADPRERRRDMLEYLSFCRKTTMQELSVRYGVSMRTIVRDINELSCSAPILTLRGRYGGGVFVQDNWYVNSRYLLSEEIAFLNELKQNLSPEDRKCLQRIIDRFSPYS